MTKAKATKTSLENKHLPNCDDLRLHHLVGKVRNNSIGVRAVKLNTENERFTVAS